MSKNQDKPFWCLCRHSVRLCDCELHKPISSAVGLVPQEGWEHLKAVWLP